MNSPTKLAQLKALVTNIPKYFTNGTFVIAGQTYTAAQVVAIVTTLLNAATTVEAAKTGVTDARLAEKALESQSGQFVKELRQIIGVAYSNDTTTLAQFDIPPKRVRAPLTAAARAAAEAKARATRAARGTKGKNQKEGITGNVKGVSITPILDPTVPGTGSATPATAAPAATGTNGAATHS
jgi:hypothetical protein